MPQKLAPQRKPQPRSVLGSNSVTDMQQPSDIRVDPAVDAAQVQPAPEKAPSERGGELGPETSYAANAVPDGTQSKQLR